MLLYITHVIMGILPRNGPKFARPVMTCGAECGHMNLQVAMPREFPEGAIPPPGWRGGRGGRAFERALWGITASWIGRDDWGGCRRTVFTSCLRLSILSALLASAKWCKVTVLKIMQG
ncbi:hypothetical protein M404DRAFT_284318 [Pisolithus tinctorius Marx 270]|uniref:Uncharacterized protein n=1 Tax=Pisolithus tinctorius Marx 270 TaxID=870435 RepID=A0A0C3JKQ8_PISTI|nr:hypothetical protein M404DRAFT_284318 [Pisolithus tinctorius Marx 270]